ncbi:MAG TPA: 5-oxoprolinase subunit PxpB [Chitinophagaceae bacterium]|nr:5-oxoprolinase subunit PxpB [Chitinophagaceae bacterium]
MSHLYHIYPLGDAAITIDFGNRIDLDINREVIARFNDWRQHPLPGMIELIPAYSSLTVHFDITSIKKKAALGSAYEWIKSKIGERLQQPVSIKSGNERSLRIPVCYDKEFAPDLLRLSAAKNIPIDEVIALHCGGNYKVYMLGFLPGFAYMGEVDERIAIGRKPQPVPITAGSIGIAGKQTGIYPLDSPGGWQIIGRTPVRLFIKDNEVPSLLQAGDCVQFYSISKNEFEDMSNQDISHR